MGGDIFVNGKKVRSTEALTDVFAEDHLSVFETLRSYRGVICHLNEHLDRLYESAKTIRLELSKTRSELQKELKRCLRRDASNDQLIRLTVDGRNSYIFVSDCPRWQRIYQEGLDLKTVVTRRNLIHSIPPEAKSRAFLNNVFGVLDLSTLLASPSRKVDGKIKKNLTGHRIYPALFLDGQGYVVEGATWNIFACKGEKLLTPQSGFLNGVTRRFVIKCAHLEGLPVLELNLTRHDLWTADEVFLTNTSGEIIPVRSVDSRTIGRSVPGPLTKRLNTRFKGELEKELQQPATSE